MPVTRHTVRKINVARQRSLDERLGPVQLGIWGLTLYLVALAGGIVYDGTPATAQRWLVGSAWAALLAAMASIAVARIPPRRLRRGLVLSFCLSLAVNVSLMVGLSRVRLVPPRLPAEAVAAVDPPTPPPPSVPEYYPLALDGEDRPRQAERRPVSTGEPDLDPRDLVRKTSLALNDPLPLQPEAVPETAPQPTIASIRRPEFIESAPRRAEWQGTLSRQEQSAEPRLGNAGSGPTLSRLPLQSLPEAVELPWQGQPQPDVAWPPPATPQDVPGPAARVTGRSSSDPLAPADPRTLPPPADLERPPSLDAERVPATPVEPLRVGRLGDPPPRQPARSDFVAPSRVETPSRPPTQPPPQDPLVRVLPLPREPAQATRDNPLVMPAMPLPSIETPEILPAAGEIKRAETPGWAMTASDPSVNLSASLAGSGADQLASPRNRPLPAVPLPRQLVTGPSRLEGSRVEVPDPAEVDVSEASGVTPTRRAADASHERLGQRQLPEVLQQPRGVPLDVGAPRAALSLPAAESRGEDQPKFVRPSAERLTTSRTPGGDFRPALPTEVPSPQVAVPGPPAATPAAASLSRDAGTRPAPSARAAPESAQIVPPPGSPRATSPNGPRRPAAIDPDDQPPRQVSSLPGGEPALERVATTPPAGPPAVDEGPPLLEPPARSSLMVTRDLQPSVDPRTVAPAVPSGAELISPPAPEGKVARRSTGGLPVDVQAAPGLGGLSGEISTDVGLLHRQAQPESDQIVDSVGRFLRRPVGGPLSIHSQVVIPARAYQSRLNRRGQEPAGGDGRPSPRTEEAIERGLAYLAQHQRTDGSWTLAEAGESVEGRRRQPLSIQSDAAATGLALLSFLGAGYHHRSDEYGEVVQDGLEYLLARQQGSGDLYVPSDESSNSSAWLYSHAIASIALCEAYGMTQDVELREPAQRAVDFIVNAQHPRRGGWRYAPGVGSDTSVSGWMVMALRSAELANLVVPTETWQRVDVWLDMAQASSDRPELYRYNPLAPNTVAQGHGRRPTKTITAVGLLMRLYTGWRRDDLQMKAGADYLLNNPPSVGTVRDPQRDTYYWYYATQVMFHMRGEYWERWNRQLHELLTSTQQQTGPSAGSWDPWLPLPDRWAPHAGRLYVTTMNLLSLEVYYRHLPIYEDTAR